VSDAALISVARLALIIAVTSGLTGVACVGGWAASHVGQREAGQAVSRSLARTIDVLLGASIGVAFTGLLILSTVHAQETEPGSASWRNKPLAERQAIVAARKGALPQPRVPLPDGVTVFDAGDGVRCFLYHHWGGLASSSTESSALSCVRVGP